MAYPIWKDMTAEQKFEFLHEWCMNMSGSARAQEATIQGLLARLQVVEENKTAGT